MSITCDINMDNGMEEIKKKVCTKCGVEKELIEFYKDIYAKDGYTGKCKECRNRYNEEWKKNNSEKEKEVRKNYYYKNRELILQKSKTEERKKKHCLYSKKCRDKVVYKEKIDRKERICPGCGLEKKIEEFHKDKYTIDGYTHQCKECRSNNARVYRTKEENKEKIRKSDNNRIKNNISVRIHKNVSRMILNDLKNNNSSKHSSSILNYLPYTIQQLKEHLESQFEPWMSWDNYGVYKIGEGKKWQVDHIIPRDYFRYITMDCEEFRQCWALSNLRPLEAIENIKKSNKLIM